MFVKSALALSIAITTLILNPSSKLWSADVIVMNLATNYEVAVSLTSPGFKTANDGYIRKGTSDLFRLASDVSETRRWDLVVWKRTSRSSDWRFSTSYRIPSDSLGQAMLGINPENDRVDFVGGAPGPGGNGIKVKPIERLTQGESNNVPDSDEKPSGPIQLGVIAYKCKEGIHIKSITAGTAATRCVDQRTGQSIQLEAGDHVLTVNGVKPRDIPEFQGLIRSSQRMIQLKVLDKRTSRTRNLTANLW